MATTVHAQGRGASVSGGRVSGERIAPRGKRSGIPIERFQQEGSDQLGGDPAARDGGVLVGNMPEPEELLEALEDELDLPAPPVEFEHPGRVGGVRGEGGEDQDEVGRLQRALGELLLCALGCPAHPTFGVRGQRRRQADGDDPSRDRWLIPHGEPHAPIAQLSHAQGACLGEGSERLAVGVGQPGMCPAQAHDQVAASRDHVVGPQRPQEVPVREQHVASFDGGPLEQLGAVRVRERLPVTTQRAQVDIASCTIASGGVLPFTRERRTTETPTLYLDSIGTTRRTESVRHFQSNQSVTITVLGTSYRRGPSCSDQTLPACHRNTFWFRRRNTLPCRTSR